MIDMPEDKLTPDMLADALETVQTVGADAAPTLLGPNGEALVPREATVAETFTRKTATHIVKSGRVKTQAEPANPPRPYPNSDGERAVDEIARQAAAVPTVNPPPPPSAGDDVGQLERRPALTDFDLLRQIVSGERAHDPEALGRKVHEATQKAIELGQLVTGPEVESADDVDPFTDLIFGQSHEEREAERDAKRAELDAKIQAIKDKRKAQRAEKQRLERQKKERARAKRKAAKKQKRRRR